MKAMVPIAEGIQPVLARIVQRTGEFVEFTDLLQDQLPPDDLNLPASLSGVVMVEPQAKKEARARFSVMGGGSHGLPGHKV